jgi:hypothetical protein
MALQGLLKANGAVCWGLARVREAEDALLPATIRLRIAAICGFCGSSHSGHDCCVFLVSDWGLMGSMVVLGANLGVLLR